MVFRRAVRRPVRAAFLVARPDLLEEGRRRHDRPVRARRRRRFDRQRHDADRAAPIRLSLYLCAGDAARPRRLRDLDDGAVSLDGVPILSIMLAIPIVAGLLCLFVSANGARWLALA